MENVDQACAVGDQLTLEQTADQTSVGISPSLSIASGPESGVAIEVRADFPDAERLMRRLGHKTLVFAEIVYGMNKAVLAKADNKQCDRGSIAERGLGELAKIVTETMNEGLKIERDPLEGVDPREQQILRLIDEGKSCQEVADLLYVAISTIKRDISVAYGKLGVRNKYGLAGLMPFEKSEYSHVSLKNLNEFTYKQIETLGFIACGWSNAETAGMLGVVLKSLETRIELIYDKLDLRSRIDIVRASRIFKNKIEDEVIDLLNGKGADMKIGKAEVDKLKKKNTAPEQIRKPAKERYYELLEKLLGRHKDGRVEGHNISGLLREELGWSFDTMNTTLQSLKRYGCLSTEQPPDGSRAIGAFVLYPDKIIRRIEKGIIPPLPFDILPQQSTPEPEENNWEEDHSKINKEGKLRFSFKAGKGFYRVAYGNKIFEKLEPFHKLLLGLGFLQSFNYAAEQRTEYLLKMVNRGRSEDKCFTVDELNQVLFSKPAQVFFEYKPDDQIKLTDEALIYLNSQKRSSIRY